MGRTWTDPDDLPDLETLKGGCLGLLLISGLLLMTVCLAVGVVQLVGWVL